MPRAVIITSYLDYPLDIPALLQADDYIVCLDGGYDIARAQGIQPHLLLGDFDSLQGDFDFLQKELPNPSNAGGFRGAGSHPAADDASAAHYGNPTNRSIDVRRYPPEKDYTDLELAFMLLDPQVYPELLVIGGLGGRLDHTIANIQMLRQYTGSTGAWEHDRDEHTCDDSTRASSNAGDAGRDHSAAASVNDGGAGPDHNAAASACTAQASAPHRFARIQLMDGRNQCFVLQGPQVCDVPRHADSYLSVFALSAQCRGLTMEGVKYPLSDFTLQRGISLCTSNEFTENIARIHLEHGCLLVVLSGREDIRDR